MIVRKIVWLAGIVALLSSGSYIFVYLYRWEWHRALIVAVIFVATEIALAAAVIIRRLKKLDQGRRDDRVDPLVLERLQRGAPRRDHFAWLEVRDGTQVFIPVLLGGGVLVSGIAWVIEKLGAKTARPVFERGLAARLSALAFPPDGLMADDEELLVEESPYRDDPELRLLLGPPGGAR